MGDIREGISFARGAAACLLAMTLSGCLFGSIDTHDSHVDGEFAVPRAVNPPADTPDVLKPYIPRFAQMLEYRGMRLEQTDDPRAFQLRLSYSADFNEIRVDADLLQDSRVVMHSEAFTREPENFSDKADLIDDLVDKAAGKFDEQLGRFGSQVTLTTPPVQEASAAQEKSGVVGFGTAFAAITPNTYVTARHVIADASKIVLYCGPNRTAKAEVLSIDTSNDLAVLHSDLKADAFLEFAPNDSAAPGDHVFTMGFPTPDLLGVEPKYTDGAISSLSGLADNRSLMQITVPVQPGNSGGPLVDTDGRVVGVITAQAAIPNFVSHAGTLPQNVNFAVSSYYVYPLVRDIPHIQDARLNKLTPVKRVTQSICLVVVEEGQSP